MFWFMLLMNLLIPLTMVFVGIYFKKAALPEINPLFGYRTRRSMASLEAWQFSNRLMGSYWFKYGLAKYDFDYFFFLVERPNRIWLLIYHACSDVCNVLYDLFG